MTAWFLLAGVVGCFSGFGLCMKLGGRAHRSPFAVSFSIFTAGSVLSGAVMLVTGSSLFNGPTVVWGVVCGVSSAGAVVLMVKAMQMGHYGFSVTVLSMSSLVPVVFAVALWGEALRFLHAMGMGVVFLALFMITCFGRAGRSAGEGDRWGAWLGILLLAFVLNGVALISHAGVASLASTNFFSFLFVAYVVSAAGLAGVVIYRRSMNRESVLFGSVGACASLVGCVLQLTCLTMLPDAVVFPIAQCAPVIVGVVISRAAFRERISGAGYVGIALGIAGVAILCGTP